MDVRAKGRLGVQLEKCQKQLRDWWWWWEEEERRKREQGGQFLKEREDDWAGHTFREHKKDADAWAGRRARDEGTVWSDVTGICGFWDDSCRALSCGG